MKIVIVRREPGVAHSMDVCADNLVYGLKSSRPDWEITEISPEPWSKDVNLWQSGTGIRKYYERLWRHPSAVKQLEGDVFHIIDHSNAHVAYWLKQKGCKIVVTCHDLVQLVYPEILNDQARFPAFSMAAWKYSVWGMSHADRVIAVSINTAKDIHEMMSIPEERITVVPNGVETHFYSLPAAEKLAIRKRYTDSSTDFCLLNVGSSHHRKNVPTILKVMARLRERGVQVQLWKVGCDFTSAQQELIQTLDLESMITFISKPNKKELLELYNAADALLAPSLYEGFGLTILEAMACGTPVITTNVSSLPEVAGNAAILVAPLDVEEIANAVCNLQKDLSLRESYIEKGHARTQLFSWAKSTEQIVRIYENL
jgi:glycosyltransferase involved in cell wall biosynthesis